MSRDSRLRREKKTLSVMVRTYCAHHHGRSARPCQECSDLLAYAFARIDACTFRNAKPTCAKCPIHCFSPASREKVRAVMRYSGPRMLYRHPYLAVAHALDGARTPRK